MPGPSVLQSEGPPNESYTHVYSYSGTNVECIGAARSSRQAVTLTVTSVSTAAAAVVTVTAHGLATDNRVIISGATGDWAGLNGTQIITRTGANTFTVPINSSGYAATFNGAITTTAPQTSKPIWAISKIYYDGSGNTVRTANALGTTAEMHKFDDIATLSFE